MLSASGNPARIQGLENPPVHYLVRIVRYAGSLSIQPFQNQWQLQLNPDLGHEEQADIIKDLVNQAMQEMQTQLMVVMRLHF